VRISPRGEVSVYGRLVGLEGAESIEFRGPVEKIITAPRPPAPAIPPRTTEVPDIPELTDPQAPVVDGLAWDRRWFRAGDDVELWFQVWQIAPGDEARVVFYVLDGEERREVDRSSVTLDKGEGIYELSWSRPAEAMQADLDAAGPEACGPLCYAFEVQVGETASALSPRLRAPVTYELVVRTLSEAGGRAYAGEPYVLRRDGVEVVRGYTGEDGALGFRCADPSARWTLEILNLELELDVGTLGPVDGEAAEAERLNLLGHDSEMPLTEVDHERNADRLAQRRWQACLGMAVHDGDLGSLERERLGRRARCPLGRIVRPPEQKED